MPMRLIKAMVLTVAACFILPLGAGAVHGQSPPDSVERARVVHLLNRIAYGPRPGDIDRVLAIGIDRFIEQQLHPERLPDDELERSLNKFQVLSLTDRDLLRIIREQRQAQRPASDPAAAQVQGKPKQRNRYALLRLQYQNVAVFRAAQSERQLYEVMADFWANHFNVFFGKGLARVLLPTYIEETIRPNALGRFEDLLVLTAQSPAMLYYLDNFQSVAPGARPREPARNMNGMLPPAEQRRADSIRAVRNARRPTGLNENYARELLELHTLGVDGGYTQEDIVNVARIFTGWSARVNQGGPMVFLPWAHDEGPKVVLGRAFPPNGGKQEGFDLLRMLASHPSTRRHLSAKLCAKFVADTPPETCIATASDAWTRSDGNIRSVVEAILTSADFWAEENRGVKVKTPLEFVVSAVRAIGADLRHETNMARHIADMGQPLFWWGPPTGYPESMESWVSSSSMLQRLNWTRVLSSGRPPETRAAISTLIPRPRDTAELVSRVNHVVLHGMATPNTLRVMREAAAAEASPVTARAVALSLALGSPEFQRQ